MDALGKYLITEELGRGGMGTVYRAHDPVIGRDVAIKVIHEQALSVPEVRARFYREARSAGRLTHDNIMTLYDVGEEQGTPYLVMELLGGTDLRRMLQVGSPLTLSQKLGIAVQICRGLQYAHDQEVIHRDIKPDNIRVLPNGRVKIVDFGIARLGDESQTLTHSSIGTPRYMSPEQIKGEPIDHRTDIFSFGVVLYELLTGINPFHGDHVTTVMYKILHTEPDPLALGDTLDGRALSEDLQPIVSRCIEKDVRRRYACFRDLETELEAVLQRRPDLQDEQTLVAGASGLLRGASSGGPHGAKPPVARDHAEADTVLDRPEAGEGDGTTRRWWRMAALVLPVLVAGGLGVQWAVSSLGGGEDPPTEVVEEGAVAAVGGEDSEAMRIGDTQEPTEGGPLADHGDPVTDEPVGGDAALAAEQPAGDRGEIPSAPAERPDAADAARGEMERAREQTYADREADGVREAFAEGETHRADGLRRYERGDYAAAADRFEAAREAFAAAGAAAGARTAALEARQVMDDAYQRADGRRGEAALEPSFREADAARTRGDAALDGLRFTDARQAFDLAAERYLAIAGAAPAVRPLADRLRDAATPVERALEQAMLTNMWTDVPASLTAYYRRQTETLLRKHDIKDVDVSFNYSAMAADGTSVRLPVSVYVTYQQKGREGTQSVPIGPLTWIWTADAASVSLQGLQQ